MKFFHSAYGLVGRELTRGIDKIGAAFMRYLDPSTREMQEAMRGIGPITPIVFSEDDRTVSEALEPEVTVEQRRDRIVFRILLRQPPAQPQSPVAPQPNPQISEHMPRIDA